jgi:hypothetical protein
LTFVFLIAREHVTSNAEIDINTNFTNREAREVNGIALGYGPDDREFESRQGLGILPFTTESRPALRPTQPPIQWIPEALSLAVKWLGHESDHSTPSSAEVMHKWSCISTHPIHFHGEVLS